MRPRRLLQLAAFAAALAPGAALACPFCAGRTGSPIAQGILLCAFVFFPFLVTYVVVRVIRQGERSLGPDND